MKIRMNEQHLRRLSAKSLHGDGSTYRHTMLKAMMTRWKRKILARPTAKQTRIHNTPVLEGRDSVSTAHDGVLSHGPS